MKLKPSLSRRDFLKLASVALGGAILACGGGDEGEGREIDNIYSVNPLPFFMTATGLKLPFPDDPVRNAQAMEKLKIVLSNPDQADQLFGALIGNRNSYQEGLFATEEAYIEGRVISIDTCSDARRLSIAKLKIPTIELGNPERFLLETRQIGAQPSLTRANKSLFFSHQILPACEGGIYCGFLGGVEQALLKGDVDAAAILEHHGAPPETIKYILEWKKMYGEELINEIKPLQDNPTLSEKLAEKWAEVGGRVKAYINVASKPPGATHTTLYGVAVDGTGELKMLGYAYADANGVQILTIDQGRALGLAPDLEGAAEFFNKQHPVLESILKQIPNVNILSVSASGPQATFGDGVIFPGNAFVVNQLGGEITAESLDILIANQGYSLRALKQGANMVYLVADSAESMTKTRQAFMASSYADEFLKAGGLIAELRVDPATGLFERTIALRNVEHPLVSLQLAPGESVLMQNGVKKILGAVNVIDGGAADTILVRVQSAVDGSIHDIPIPRGSAYSAITAEVLERYGIPLAESSWFEKCFMSLGGIVGKAIIVAGISLMIWDGYNYLVDVSGIGETIEVPWSEKTVADMANRELWNAISEMHMLDTPANRLYITNVVEDAKKRIAKMRYDAKGLGTPMPETSYFMRLDGRVDNIVAFLNDSRYDMIAPIKVELTFTTEGYDPIYDMAGTVINSMTFTNTITNEKIVLTKNDDGSYSKTGLDKFEFDVAVLKPETKQFLAVPVKFQIDDQVMGVFSPNWPTRTSSFERKNKLASNTQKPTTSLWQRLFEYLDEPISLKQDTKV